MSIKALDVANYILWLENRFEGSEGITPLKLQKLVYYCQAFIWQCLMKNYSQRA